jgi:hypothetical protein
MTVYLLAGALAGYALLIFTNPVRTCLLDGLRAVHRYPRLWLSLGLFGFGYAVFQLVLRFFFASPAPSGEEPTLLWARSAYRAQGWWAGAPDSLWYVPPGAFQALAKSALLPALDSLGGLFNNVVSTFPLAALAALLLLINWRGHQSTLRRALARRFGLWGWALYPLILLAALAALLKPLVFFLPRYVDLALWFRWAPVDAWLAFIFEYLFGVGVQVYLLSLAYCWLRGISFGHQQLLDFAIRRFSFVARWAFAILLLSTVLVDLPLLIKAFQPASDMAAATAELDERNALARAILNVVFIAFATVQVTLVFHNESLRRSLRDHCRFVLNHPGALGWFILLAAVHLYALHFLNALCLAALGEGTAAWIGWTLLFPWLAGFFAACLLAAWVSAFRRADTGKLADKSFARF